GAQMFYGAGYAKGDDVDGHELTHGLTDFTSHLMYFYETGAINEAMSDIMGEFIDQDFNDSHDNDAAVAKWLMGEDIPGGAIRNMKNPPADGQPDRMPTPVWLKAAHFYPDAYHYRDDHYERRARKQAHN